MCIVFGVIKMLRKQSHLFGRTTVLEGGEC